MVDTVRGPVEAVARAHLIAGAPIVVHTSAAHRTGLVAQDVFCQDVFCCEGVDPGALVLDHSGVTTMLVDNPRRFLSWGRP